MDDQLPENGRFWEMADRLPKCARETGFRSLDIYSDNLHSKYRLIDEFRDCRQRVFFNPHAGRPAKRAGSLVPDVQDMPRTICLGRRGRPADVLAGYWGRLYCPLCGRGTVKASGDGGPHADDAKSLSGVEHRLGTCSPIRRSLAAARRSR